MANRVLGRGLASLIPNKPAAIQVDNDATDRVIQISLDQIRSNPHQPRQVFVKEQLEDLAQSIREHGVLQPVVVSKVPGGYELIAGERRCQASRLAGKSTVPAIVREVNEQQKLEHALIENVQRHNLNALEEAKAYQKLSNEFNLTQEDISKQIGKSRVYVTNAIRLLGLPEEIQRGLMEEKITAGHARALLQLKTTEEQIALYHQMLDSKMSVREVEEKSRPQNAPVKRRTQSSNSLGQVVEDGLREFLGTKVRVQEHGGKGKIIVEYFSQQELRDLYERLTRTSLD